jgi:diguanylate cyclase (GGDEF)-like protein
MAATIRQLERFNRDEEALSSMTELLQCCADRAEAYAIIAETVTKLFPDTAGHLYIYRESRDLLEKAASWGATQAAESSLAPHECWALRLGKPHQTGRGAGMRCVHARRGVRPSACLPVQGQGQILGMLHIVVENASRDESVARRLRALTDAIGPALANLRLRDALREMALRDTLTGLYNRRYLEDAIVRELHRAERGGKPVAVIMIDIDHFKRFNDKYGHDAGDFVLGAVGRTITANVRPSDLACRYGGEELAVVMPDANLEVACARAEKLRLAVRETNLTHLGQNLPAPSASFGVAAFPMHGGKPAELFKAADLALYEAKQRGRDRVCAAPAAIERVLGAASDSSTPAS